MEYIDFVDINQRCSKCHKKLTSGIAIYSNGFFLGNTCAEQIGILKSELPNLTKGIKNEVQDNTYNYLGKKQHSIIKLESKQRCLSYLITRIEKLYDIKNMKYQKLIDIYEKYKTDNLLLDDYYYLENLIKSVNEKNKIVSEKNVYFCYAVKNALISLIKKNPDNNFYKSILNYLKQNATVSKPQFDCLINDSKLNIKYYDYQ